MPGWEARQTRHFTIYTEELRVLLDDLDRLPFRQGGFQAWYPPEVVASVK